MIQISYLTELKNIRKFMEKQRCVNPGNLFPANHCDHTSHLVNGILGLPVVYGTLNGQVHTQNADYENGFYIDLTRDQFGPNFPKITATKIGEDTGYKEFSMKEFIAMDSHIREVVRNPVGHLLVKYKRKEQYLTV